MCVCVCILFQISFNFIGGRAPIQENTKQNEKSFYKWSKSDRQSRTSRRKCQSSGWLSVRRPRVIGVCQAFLWSLSIWKEEDFSIHHPFSSFSLLSGESAVFQTLCWLISCPWPPAGGHLKVLPLETEDRGLLYSVVWVLMRNGFEIMLIRPLLVKGPPRWVIKSESSSRRKAGFLRCGWLRDIVQRALGNDDVLIFRLSCIISENKFCLENFVLRSQESLVFVNRHLKCKYVDFKLAS